MLYRVYVDEAGDLGLSPASSRHFILSAVIVSDANEGRLADIAASAVFKGVEPDRFGNVEPRYVNELRPKLYPPESAPVLSSA